MKYKDRYELAEGYPFTYDVTKKIKNLQIVSRPDNIEEEDAIYLKIPEYLLSDVRMPRYRLVLEKIGNKED